MSEVKEKPKRDRKEYMKKYHKERYENIKDDAKFNRLLEYYIARNSLPRSTSKLMDMCKERNLNVTDALEQRKKEIRTP